MPSDGGLSCGDFAGSFFIRRSYPGEKEPFTSAMISEGMAESPALNCGGRESTIPGLRIFWAEFQPHQLGPLTNVEPCLSIFHERPKIPCWDFQQKPSSSASALKHNPPGATSSMASNGTNGLGGQARKAAIVTGGASGIGLAMSQYFASQGYNVAIFDVTTGSGQAVVAELASENPEAKFIFRKCDVSSWQEQATSFKEIYGVFGRIDVVCANAGISEKGGSAMASIKDHEPQKPNLQVLDVNLTGVIYCEDSSEHFYSGNYLLMAVNSF